jgi:hypothetical protein
MLARAARPAALVLSSAMLAAACSGGSAPGAITTTPPGPPCDAPATPQLRPPTPRPSSVAATTIDHVAKGSASLSLLSSPTRTRPGRQTFGFDLTNGQNQLLTGGNPVVWLAKSRTAKAAGPFLAQWLPFTAYAECHDRSPRSPLPGLYAATIDVPSVGRWFVAVSVSGVGRKGVAVGDPTANPPGGLNATDGPVPAQLGTKAVSVRTPVATTERGLKEVCTRTPPDPLHYISLDKALASGKPTVVVFATPLLCESRLCGPVVDEAMLAFQQIGRARANFIHVEEFLPGPALRPPAPTLQNQSPGFKAWRLMTEPWTVVIDRNGVIRGRFEGPVTAPQIEAALMPLL